MPKKREFIEVGPFRYEVYRSPVSMDGTNGVTDANAKVISLDSTCHPDTVRETLLHEVLHAIMDVTGLRTGKEDEAIEVTEEKLVATLSPWILTVLRANPKLVEELLEVS